MKNLAIIIPAQEHNRYHEKGDLAPFGDTTLLEWKIAQCKSIVPAELIYISSLSQEIQQIARNEKVKFIQRIAHYDYLDIMMHNLEQIECDNVLYAHCTSPFMSALNYKKMYHFFKETQLDSLYSARKIQEFVIFKDQALNFKNISSSRLNLEPIYIITNGCFIFKRKEALEKRSFLPSKSKSFEVDYLSSIEIKDVSDYVIAKELITMYFRKEN